MNDMEANKMYEHRFMKREREGVRRKKKKRKKQRNTTVYHTQKTHEIPEIVNS